MKSSSDKNFKVFFPDEVYRRKIINKIKILVITFSDIFLAEEALFWGQIFETDIVMDLYFLRSPESKNHILSGGSGCQCACLLSVELKNKLHQKV